MPRKGRSSEENVHAIRQVEGGERVAEICQTVMSRQPCSPARWPGREAGGSQCVASRARSRTGPVNASATMP
jgi:hypothetical protein